MPRIAILVINDQHRWIGYWNNLHEASVSLNGYDFLSIAIYEITSEGATKSKHVLFKPYRLQSVDSDTLVYHAKQYPNRTTLARLENYLAECGFRKYGYHLAERKATPLSVVKNKQ